MRILLVAPSYPPVLNSTARLYSELAEDLQEAGHEATVLTTVPDRYLADDEDGRDVTGRSFVETIDGVTVHRLRKLPVPQKVPAARAVERFGLGASARWIGRRLEPHDAVITYSPPLPLVLAAESLANRWDAPVIQNVQDIYPQTVIDLGLLENRLLVGAAEHLEKRAYRGADRITVHSTGNKRFLVDRKGLDPEEVTVVENWVDLEGTTPGSRENEWREDHGIGPDDFVVSFAGAMGFAQGLEDILHAADRLRDRDDLVFLMVGGGTFRDDLEVLATDLDLPNLRFLPPQPPDAYDALLQASDVSLVPLNGDLATPVVPGKLQSIMAAGRPAIQYSNPASDGKRIIEEAECGLFVEAGNVDGLAEGIEHLHDNPDVARSMGKQARSYAEEHFDRRTSTRRYLDILDDITD